MTRDEARKIMEVLLFVSERPIGLEKIIQVLEGFDKDKVRSIMTELNDEYAKTNRSFSINEVGGGFQILTDPFYAPWVRKLLVKEKKFKFSVPALETLAIIAYKQPLTRAEIETIRGVNIEGVLETLLERGIIKTMGRKDVVGRPFLYGTTKEFLTHFGLNTLDDLPSLREFTEDDIQLGKDELVRREGEKQDEERVEDAKEVTQKD